MVMHSTWEGYLKLNLLSVPIKAYTAAIGVKSKISFHQIHANCGERIHHQKVCPIHGEVSNDEIVPGYEYGKDEYVIVPAEELKELRPQDEKTLAIEVFISPDEIDPLYYSERSYYLLPDGKIGQKPYVVISKVMADEQLNAIGRLVLSGREQIGLIRSLDGLLVMTLLTYEEQIKKPETFKNEVPDVELPKEEVELAKILVRASTSKKFDFSAYHDEYENEVAELIDAKAKGKKLSYPSPQDKPVVLNLMDALKRSIAAAQNKEKKNPVRKQLAKQKKTG